MRLLSALAGCGLAVALLAGGCKKATVSRNDEGRLYLGSHESSDTVERVVSPGERQLVLEGYAGTIRVGASNSDVARLTITRRARGDSPTEAQKNLSGMDVQEDGDELAFRYRFVAERPEFSRYDITGEIPAKTSLVVKWTSGSIQLDGFRGSVDVQTVNGDVGYIGESRKVRLQSRNGDVSATILAMQTRTGVDSLAPIPAAPLSYEFITANGDLAVSIPAGIGVHVDALTSAGSIRTAALPFINEELGPVNAGARFRARMGTGSGQLKLATQHGSILLRESLPPPTRNDTTMEADASDLPGDDAAGAPPDSSAAGTSVPAPRAVPSEALPADSARSSSN